MLKIVTISCLLLLPLFAGAKDAIWVHIDTQQLVLEVKSGNTTLSRFSNISLGRNGSGFKKKRGDDITPHGRYKITWINRKSRYHLFFGVNYPSKENAQQAFDQKIITKKDYRRILHAHKNNQTPPQNTPMGGLIGIHGLGHGDKKIHEMMNWTHGCIALTNEQINNLDTLIKKETLVIID
ncbi:MAG: L,D-transpeptidase [Gammaproteobacteria bacterium]|nr:L,D-transpeptidase [Gammaproteobacteria bacterium]